MKRFAVCAVMLMGCAPLLAQAAATFPSGPDAAVQPQGPGKGQLFVGTRYQPVDRSPEQIRKDFTTSYHDQQASALEPFFEDNIDAALINIAHSRLDYKLLVVPADYVMDAASAEAIRSYVQGGGTVVMTAFSAKVDEHSQWFDTPLPGRLSDVFGIRTSQFYRPNVLPEISLAGKAATASIDFYEVLEPNGAQTLASFTNTPEKSPAITVHQYGKGRAIYVALPSQMPILAPLVRSLCEELHIERGPATPSGVYARVVEGRTLYVNTTGEQKTIPVHGKEHGVISGRTYDNSILLPPYGVELAQE